MGNLWSSGISMRLGLDLIKLKTNSAMTHVPILSAKVRRMVMATSRHR
jgi:hypothetical protein